MPSHIALRGLPIENLKRKPFRTGALLAVVTILALTFFGGTMLTMNLNTGMTSMEKRLGADLMVVPQNTVQKAEALLTNGNPSTFYFTKDIADEVMQADGIAQATEQTYISSLAAACCAEKLQIIGYDPDTDFVIEPWVASQFEGPLEDGQMIAGANVNVSTDGTIELYGRSWPVVASSPTPAPASTTRCSSTKTPCPTWSPPRPRSPSRSCPPNMPAKPSPP